MNAVERICVGTGQRPTGQGPIGQTPTGQRPTGQGPTGQTPRWGQLRIVMRPQAVDSAALRALTRICPARCFSFDLADRVAFDPEGCTFCGTCVAVCGATGEIDRIAPQSRT